ncbi:MAG TPA: inner membrane CreD family protein [Candidatus Dormibacteraeota bacterium]|jgi:inner membrane protein involved in colicin E2 resistance|nr:inner membrane CreD family protein [Candidatus Dormibacteraeota bacterium]
MFKRIAAIIGIFACTCIAWMILGTSIFVRTDNLGSVLSSRVGSTWGTTQGQKPPSVTYYTQEVKTTEVEEKGKKIQKTETVSIPHDIELNSSRINADFHIDYRQKGLLWFSTYKVAFGGTYTFQNSTGKDQNILIELPLPAKQAVYDGLEIELDGTPLKISIGGTEVSADAHIAAGTTSTIKTGYRSQGLDSWSYQLSSGDGVARINDFHLTMKTDFDGFDFPENTLSPTEKHGTVDGWELKWDYQNLVSGFNVALKMPQKLQPGPLAGRISYFAPVSLFFFFFLVFILSTLRGIDLHPMNYFFLAAAFFAFHLLLAYLCDHTSIHAAFVISSLVSILLVVSYLRLVVNLRFALVDAGLSQLIYLVLFSYAFFFEGFTGLAVTIGAILTLFVVMQMTGRIQWAERFGKGSARPLGSLAGS